MSISVVINTYNAKQHLAEVLESVKGFDEILICDMESTDTTLDIAKRYGCRIVTFPRREYSIVEPAREFAIRQALCEWVLVVDADEVVPDALKEYLYVHTQKPDAADGLFVTRKNYFMGRFLHAAYPDYILRFFRREKTTWPPIIHVSPKVAGKVERIPRSRQDLAFIHLANDTVSDRLHKIDVYTDNELQKKHDKHYGCVSFLWRPFFRFFKAYVLKGGIRDGIPGFVQAMMEGYYQLVMLAKIKEKTCKQSKI